MAENDKKSKSSKQLSTITGLAGILGEKTVRGLSDKLYDKRKNAALMIQRTVEELATQKNFEQVEALANGLHVEFVQSSNANSRKGGLIGLAATAIGLGKDIDQLLPTLVPPVLPCLTDADTRVRYYACEALYNISKVAFSAMLTYFIEIFNGLCEIYGEPVETVSPRDGSAGVRTGADMLDRLIKDIVIEKNELPNVSSVIVSLRERLHTTNQLQRQFLVSWISVLSLAPGIDLLRYAPNILEGLFTILCDDNFQIRRMCEEVLDTFLAEFSAANNNLGYVVDYPAMMETLIEFCSPSKHLLARFMAVTWIREFITLASTRMLPFAGVIVEAVLPCLAMTIDEKLRSLADLTNRDLVDLISACDLEMLTKGPPPVADADTVARAIKRAPEATPDVVRPSTKPTKPEAQAAPDTPPGQGSGSGSGVGVGLGGLGQKEGSEAGSASPNVAGEIALPLSEPTEADTVFSHGHMIQVLTIQLLHDSVATRMATLSWFSMLHAKMPLQMFEHVQEFGPALLKSLSDNSDKVVRLDLQVLAELSTDTGEAGSKEADAKLTTESNAFFNGFVVDLLKLFSTDRELLEYRGSFVIRHLSTFIDAERLYRALADNLLNEDDLEFANRMIQNLNLILLTAPELHELRHELKALATVESRSLFTTLYKSWNHNAVATFSLCLLTQVYEHACHLIIKFGDFEVTVSFLVELDKLIQLLESPIFTFLRLHLLEPEKYAFLVKALYGMLMLLPQSSAFSTLKNRLDCIPTIISSLRMLNTDLAKKQAAKKKAVDIRASIDFNALAGHFDEVQRLHIDAIKRGEHGRAPALFSDSAIAE